MSEQMESDLDWLARNVHEWRDGANFICLSHNDWQPVFSDHPRYCAKWFTKASWLARRAELQNKPSWADAPEWAEWLAQDSYGCWGWFQQRPVTQSLAWFSSSGYYSMNSPGHLVIGGWRDTLEQRPDMHKSEAEIDTSEKCVQKSAESIHDEPVSADEANQIAKRLIALLQADAWAFGTHVLADLYGSCDAELNKRDADVCGGQKYLDAHWFESKKRQPPVGAICEVSECALNNWRQVLVKGYFDGQVWLSDGDKAYDVMEVEFRPIRTERERMIDSIIDLLNVGGSYHAAATRIYDAILAAGFKR